MSSLTLFSLVFTNELNLDDLFFAPLVDFIHVALSRQELLSKQHHDATDINHTPRPLNSYSRYVLNSMVFDKACSLDSLPSSGLLVSAKHHTLLAPGILFYVALASTSLFMKSLCFGLSLILSIDLVVFNTFDSHQLK